MNGLITKKSHLKYTETTAKIASSLEHEGFTIFSRISHHKNAEKHGRLLRPTELFIFGNPKSGGTGLMQENQTIAIDLPAKILVWEDGNGKTQITFNAISWIAQRHLLSERNAVIIEDLQKAIERVIEKSVS